MVLKNAPEIPVSLEPESPEPLFAQVMIAIKDAVLDGRVTSGDPLPSIRRLAGDLKLNNKTVAKAYRLLERDGVIRTRGYRGTFIHPDAVANSTVDLAAWVHSIVSEAVKACRSVGATDSEIRIAFGSVMQGRPARGSSP